MLEAFDFVIFGGAGDLALRKLIPGLYRAHREGSLAAGTRIIPTCRNTKMVAEYKDKVRAAAEEHLNVDEFDAAAWDALF
jgi:glucose-6-phosphate 1-dehydrogenase